MRSESNSLAIIGSGGHGAVIADIANDLGTFQSIKFYDDKFDDDNSIQALLNETPENRQVVIAIGDNETRLKLAKKFEELRFKFATLLHPTIVLGSDVKVGVGTVAMANTVINTASRIGNHCILNTGSTVDHHCKLEHGVHLAPGVNIAGGVSIGKAAFLGTGSGVIPNRKIGTYAIVGAGSIVINDVEPNVTVVGVPAR